MATLVSLMMAGAASGASDLDEWQEIPETQIRIQTATPEKVPSRTEQQTSDIYKRGQGDINGAFGFSFDSPVDPRFIIRDSGWIEPPRLPDGYEYYGLLKPFKIHAYHVVPPLVPAILKGGTVNYRCFVGFDGKPIWIEADIGDLASTVGPILERKYGKPASDKAGNKLFTDGVNLIRLDTQSRSQKLDYFSAMGLGQYLEQRNLTLRRKYEGARANLTPEESRILELADQLTELRKNIDSGFGIPFHKRIHFKAKPDEYVEFEPPEPITGLGPATYKIMVSPDLIPVMIRMEIAADDSSLSFTKFLLDEALNLSFGGFLKNSPNHTVISLQGNSISVMIRQGVLSLTLLDGSENKLANERNKQKEMLKRQAAEMETRRNEIKTERGF